MRALLALLLLLLASPAWAMEHYTQVLIDNRGNAIKDATVYVYTAGTTTPATLYSDNGITPKANPFQTSNSSTSPGAYDFYAADGVYDLVFLKEGYSFDAALTRRIAIFDVTTFSGGGGGGSGTSLFADLLSGTNSTATMVVGSGATLSTSGSGSIDASLFKGNTTIPFADGGTNQTSWTASRCVHVNAGGTALEATSADCLAAPSFSTLSTGSNTSAAMTVGSGASLNVSGSGTITATGVTANSVALTTDTTGNYVSSATASQGLLLTGTEGGSLGLQVCTNGQILKNSGGTSWICSADSTGGTPTFDTVAAGTNTTAAMVVSTGASLTTTGSGTITATTSAALAANASNCTAGSGAGGVSATGLAEDCTNYMEEPGTTGLVARTAANTASARTITGTASEISVTNGDGVSGNPLLALPSTLNFTGKTVTVGSGGSIAVSGSGTIVATGVIANAVALTTGTTGDYVSGITANQGLLKTGTEGASVGLIACNNGEVLKNSGGTSWICATDATNGAFSAITSGANTTATMVVGSGATLTYSGSGILNASSFRGNAVAAVADGGTNLTVATDDNVMLGNGTTWVSATIPSCSNGTISKLLYTSATNAFSCGTDQSSGGGTTFDAIGGGTNTTAAMIVGSGGTLTPTGTGLIAATAVRPTVTTVNAGNSPYTLLTTDLFVLCDTTAAARIITLVAASNKQLVKVKNLGANTCTVNRAGADTIDGSTSAILRNQYDAVEFVSDASASWSAF